MEEFRITWKSTRESVDVVVVGTEELLHQLTAAKTAGEALMVFIWNAGSERELSLGLCDEGYVATYQGSLDPPYYVSGTDDPKQGEIPFWAGSENTCFLRSNLVTSVPLPTLIEEFATTMELPSCIVWTKL